MHCRRRWPGRVDTDRRDAAACPAWPTAPISGPEEDRAGRGKSCMAAEAVGRFVDTNVLVYAHDSSAGAKRVIARDLLQGLWQTGAGRLSVQVLQEFFVALTRKVRKPLAVEDARAIVADLAHSQIHAPASADVLAAIDLHRRGG